MNRSDVQSYSESFERVPEVLNRLRGVRKSGKGWTAKCPAHDDNHNSLSLSEGSGGKALLYCHAGCPYKRIIAELGFIANNNIMHRSVKAYPYYDENGALLYEALRYEPKGFAVRRPDGNDGYINNLNGVRRVLYRLPELHKAKAGQQTILIVEGEKDADRLAKLGFTVTTNVGGAGKWREDYSEELRGQFVAILPDNDDAGRKHGEKVAHSLHGIAASVKIIELPGLLPKGDVSNWLDTGGTPETLRALINVAPSKPNPFVPNSGQIHKTFPTLDNKALHGLAGEFVETILPQTEADRAALLVQMLVGFGNVIGRGPYFVAESTRHYTNLYALIIGDTSAAKGSSFAQVRNVLSRVDEGWEKDCNKSGLSSGEGLIEAVGEIDKRVFLKESEFVTVLARQYRDASVLSATLRELWDDGNARVMNRKHNALSATNAHVSLIGHITPEELAKRLNATDLANGYANRFLFAYVRRSKDLADGGNLPERAVNALVKKIQDAKQFAEGIGEMKRDDEAKELWRAIYPRLVSDKGGMFGKVVARARAQVGRLSCIYALLEHSEEVKQVHLEAALALWQYCEDSARYIFAEGLVLSNNAQKLYDALCKAGKVGLTRTAQFGVFNSNLAAKELDTLTSELVGAGLVMLKEATDGSRKHCLVAITNYELDESDAQDANSLIRNSYDNGQLSTTSETPEQPSSCISDEEAEAEAMREYYYRSDNDNEEVL